MFRILIPTDFSPAANTAIKYAVSLSENFESLTITLFHCIDTSDLSSGFIHKIEDVLLKEAENEIKKTAEGILEELKTGTKVDFDVVFGNTEEQIIKKASNNEVDLIVMGTKGAGGLKRLFIGSIASEVVEKNTYCPLIVVPHNTPMRPVTEIVYATDLADLESEAELVIAFAKLSNAHVSILHITDDPEKEIKFNTIKETEKLTHKTNYSNISFNVLFNLDVIEGIENFLTAKEISMIALFSRRKTEFEKIFDNSLSKEMSFHSNIPLLILPYDLIIK